MTIVFIEPTRNRNDFLSCFVISEAIVAAWPEPIPGRNEQSGAVKAEERDTFRKSDFFRFRDFIFSNCCFGKFADFDFKLITKADVPKRPVSKGKRGSFIGRFNVNSPRKPESAKTTREIKNSSSLNIR